MSTVGELRKLNPGLGIAYRMSSNLDLDTVTFDDCKNHPVGETYYELEGGDGYCGIIRRGLSALHVYVGIPLTHPLAGKSTLVADLDIKVHCGFNFSEIGRGSNIVGEALYAGYAWFGWDYGHAGDEKFQAVFSTNSLYALKKWTPSMVVPELIDAIEQFREAARAYAEDTKDVTPSDGTSDLGLFVITEDGADEIPMPMAVCADVETAFMFVFERLAYFQANMANDPEGATFLATSEMLDSTRSEWMVTARDADMCTVAYIYVHSHFRLLDQKFYRLLEASNG